MFFQARCWVRGSLSRFIAVLFCGCLGALSHAAVLTNGSLSVTIDDTNGAIDAVTFGGSDFFNPGAPVSNFGFQRGTDISTFQINTTTGGSDISVVAVSAGTASAVAVSFDVSQTAGIQIVRTYQLIENVNALRIVTSLVNTDGSPVTATIFDTFDPDQGVDQGEGTSTFNDVSTFGGQTFGIASASTGGGSSGGKGLTVISTSSDNEAVFASGGPFQISNGTDLNDFIANPVDGEGLFADSGMHVARRTTIAPDGFFQTSFDLIFGLTDDDALEVLAIVVPEPSTAGVLILAALAGCRRRRGS